LGVVSLGLRGVSWKQIVVDIKAAYKRWWHKEWQGTVIEFLTLLYILLRYICGGQ
jgi:hypothetical protein